MNYLLSLLMLFAGALHAEAPKPFIPEEPEMKGYWWPVYIDASGKREESFYGLPLGDYPTAANGTLLDDIETVIYARAIFKPRVRTILSLEELIEDDQQQFRRRDPDAVIRAVEPVMTTEGDALRSYLYISQKGNSWEQVSYSEEGQFYLLFTIRSQSQHRYVEDLPSYLNYIRKYRKLLVNSARQISNRREPIRGPAAVR